MNLKVIESGTGLIFIFIGLLIGWSKDLLRNVNGIVDLFYVSIYVNCIVIKYCLSFNL